MRISAKVDHAVRASVELAAAPDEKPTKAERIATTQDIPLSFLENVLGELPGSTGSPTTRRRGSTAGAGD